MNIHVVIISIYIVSYLTMSHLVFELSDVNTSTGQEIGFELKKTELNGIRFMRCSYEELINQNPR